MARRGKGEGSVRLRKDGRWEARLSIPGAGQVSLYGATRAEVIEQLSSLQRDVRAGVNVADSHQPYRDYLAHWLEVKRPQVSESTYDDYLMVIQTHIEPVIGDVRLSDLTPAHIERVYARMLARGLVALHVTRAVLSGSLRVAERHGLVARNVSRLVDVPRRAKRQYTFYDPDQALAYVAAARQMAATGAGLSSRLSLRSFDAACALPLIVLLMTGLRCGELCALRWSDVDLRPAVGSAPSLVVWRSFRWGHGDPVFSDHPKTESSNRRVFLIPQAVEALTLWRAAQHKQRLLAGPAWQTSMVGISECHAGEQIAFDGLVCTDALGRPWANHTIPLIHRKIARLAGLPLIRPHDLRHSCSTLLQEQGVLPKVVSVMLGHSRVEMTLNVYSHVTPAMQMEAMKTLARVFTPPDPLKQDEHTAEE
jgi:integrase